jgi:HD-like signal output (HDOD) protein
MTSTLPTRDEDPLILTTRTGLEQVLASIDTMSSQRPVAAQIVSATTSEDVSARELSRVLAADVALAGRVMKLANSATFGMRGRVDSLQFAVTVVGFTTVRTMATVALTDLDGEARLPEDFWATATSLALAAATVAPRFGQRPQDALCIGLLAEVGTALLHHNDPEGYRAVVDSTQSSGARRAAEQRRYGMPAVELSALALERWNFPDSVVAPLRRIDVMGSTKGALLRVGYEVAWRLTVPDYAPQAVARLSSARLTEEALAPLLLLVREEAGELRRALLDD